jgi:O-antigen ligase
MAMFSKCSHTPFQTGVWLLCFTLPLSPRLTAWLTALLFGYWLFRLPRNTSLKRLLQMPAPLLPALFLLYLAGLLWSQYPDTGWMRVETKLPLLVFPLLLIAAPEKIELRHTLTAFIAGCTAAALLSLGAAGWHFFQTGEARFTYSKLTQFLKFHPTYFALYLNLALFVLATRLPEQTGWKKAALGVLTGFLILFLLLLSARMQILILAALAFAALWIKALQKRSFKQAVIASTGALVLLLGLIALLPSTRMRFAAIVRQPANVRIQTWETAATLALQHPLTGVGTGSFQEAQNSLYREKNHSKPLADQLNAHNQYLQTAATLGIPAGLLWILILAWPFALAWKLRQPLFLWFLALVFLSNLTESMLETQRGTLFTGFFFSLFLAAFLAKKPKAFKPELTKAVL